MMHDTAVLALRAWETFYVIVGSSAAALTGLQFVVIALIAESGRQGDRQGIEAFGTPTIVHFCASLLVAAILTVPWHGSGWPAFLIGVAGVAGIAYAVITVRRAQRQTGYKPVLEDWLWHTILPAGSHVGLVLGAIAFAQRTPSGLFIIGAAALLLLFIGIHNAWDAVIFITTERWGQPKEQSLE